MSATTPDVEPAEFQAGDTLIFEIANSDYPASEGWTLYYVLVKSDEQITFNSTQDGDVHSIDIASTITSGWEAGEYSWIAYVENDDGDRHTVRRGVIIILPDLSQETTGYDARSTAKIILDAIRATISGKATSAQLSRKVGDRELRYMTPSSLAEWELVYEEKVEDEEMEQALANGEKIKNKILVRFIDA